MTTSKSFSRLTSLLLAVLMLVTVFPVGVFADDVEEVVTEATAAAEAIEVDAPAEAEAEAVESAEPAEEPAPAPAEEPADEPAEEPAAEAPEETVEAVIPELEADEPMAVVIVASIEREDGLHQYESLEEAFTDAQNGETILLLANTLSTHFTMSKQVTLDLNGKKLKINADEGAKAVAGGVLTIKNGTLESEMTDFLSAAGGKIVLESGLTVNGTSSLIYAYDGGIVEINGAALNANESTYVAAFAEGVDSEIVINSGSIYCEGNNAAGAKNDATVTVKGGKLETNNTYPAAYSANFGCIVVEGGELLSNGGYSLIAAKDGELTVSGGNLPQGILVHEGYDSFASITGGSIPLVDVKNGVVRIDSGAAVGKLRVYGGEAHVGAATVNGELTVTGGVAYISADATVKGAVSVTEPGILDVALGAKFADETVKPYLGNDKHLEKDGDYYVVTINKYTVTFDAKGGTPAPEAQTITHGEKATRPADPTKDGYGFFGWLNGEAAYDFDAEVTADLTLTADWRENTYTVKYMFLDPEDTAAVEIEIDSASAEFGKTIQLRAAYEITGYTFKGWKTEGDETVYAAGADYVIPSKNVKFIAVYEINQYKIDFRMNDDETNHATQVAGQKVNYKATVEKPEDPTRPNYIFKGWTLEGAPYDFATPVTDDIILDANWEGEPHTVVYHDGMSHILASYNVKYGDPTPAYDGELPTREGYRLKTEAEGRWSPAIAALVTEDAVYNAQWQKLATLHFDNNGWEPERNATDHVVDQGKTTSINFTYASDFLPNVTKDGEVYEFVAWATNPNATYAEAEYKKTVLGENGTRETVRPYSITMNEDLTVYAVYEKQYTLKIDARGGSVSPSSLVTGTKGVFVSFYPTNVKQTGYTLLGFATTEEATEPEIIARSGIYYLHLTKDTTLYALWQGKEVTVKYDLNGATGTVPETVTYRVGEQHDVVMPALGDIAKEGRVFLGWSFNKKITDLNYNKDLTAAQLANIYQPGQTVTADQFGTANITIYATWKYTGVVETIDFNAEGATYCWTQSGYPKTVNYGSTWSLPLLGTSAYKTTPLPDGTSIAKNLAACWYLPEDNTVHPHGNSAAGARGKLTMNKDVTAVVLYKNTVITFMADGEAVGYALQEISRMDTSAVYQLEEYPYLTKAVAIEGPAKYGYTFQGWALEADGEVVYQPGDAIAATVRDMKLYAIYTINQYTVTFSGPTGFKAIDPMTVDYKTEITLPEGEIEGWTFVGWLVGWKDENGDDMSTTLNAGEKFTVISDTIAVAINRAKVTFVAEGDEIDPVDPATIPEPQLIEPLGKVTEPTLIPDRGPNYTFDGWYLNGELYDFDSEVMDGDFTLEAKWKGIPCVVIYSDGLGNALMQYTVPYGSETPTIDKPTRTDYRFVKWDPEVDEIVRRSIIYTAVWELDEYTVTFVVDDTETQVTVMNGTVIDEPDHDEREGYTFLGWFEEGAEEPFDFSTPITKNMTLTAVYEANTYYALFFVAEEPLYDEEYGEWWLDPEGEEGFCDYIGYEPIPYGTIGALGTYYWYYGPTMADPVAELHDWVIDHWVAVSWEDLANFDFDSLTDEEWENLWDVVGTPFDLENEPIPIADDCYVIAMWKNAKISVDMDEEITHAEPYEYTARVGSRQQLWLPGDEVGYSFKSWTVTDANGEHVFTPDMEMNDYGCFDYTVIGDASFKAEWTKKKAVTLHMGEKGRAVNSEWYIPDYNWGTDAMFYFDTVDGKFPVSYISAYHQDGYEFMGFSKNEDGSTLDFPAIVENQTHSDTIRYDGDLIEDGSDLYAVWAPMYQLTYVNNSTTTYRPGNYRAKGAWVMLSTAVPTKRDYKFVGWYYDEELTEACEWEPGTYHRIYEDTTLYAKWEYNVFTVAFVDDNDNLVEEQEIRGGWKAKQPVLEAREGCTFLGWFEEDAEEPFDFETPIYAELVLYARYEYRIIFIDGETETTVYVKTGEYLEEPDPIGMEGYKFRFWGYEESFVDEETGETITNVWEFDFEHSIHDSYEIFAVYGKLRTFTFMDGDEVVGTITFAQGEYPDYDEYPWLFPEDTEDKMFLYWADETGDLFLDWAEVEDDMTLYARWLYLTLGVDAPFAEEGTYDVEGESITFHDLKLDWVAKDETIGRTVDGWWVDARMILPEFVFIGEEGNNLDSFQISLDEGETWLPLAEVHDGMNEDGRVVVNVWLLVNDAKVLAALEAEKTQLTYKVLFRVNPEIEEYDEEAYANLSRTLTINIDISNIELDKVDGDSTVELKVEDGEVVDRNLYFKVIFMQDEETVWKEYKLRFKESVAVADVGEPEVEGKHFKGWSLIPDGDVWADENGEPWAAFCPYYSPEPIEQLVLFPVYEDLVTVTFDPDNGEDPWAVQIVKGAKVEKPEDPENEGYIFKGWAVKQQEEVFDMIAYSEEIALFDFDTAIEEDLELIALWEDEYVVPEAASNVMSTTVSFDGNLFVNAYIVVPDEIRALEGAYVLITFNDEQTKVLLADAEISMSGDVERLRFSREIYAKMMRDPVAFEIYDARGNQLNLTYKGEALETNVFVTTVVTYLDSRIANSSNPKMVKLSKVTRLYGIAAQVYFDYKTEEQLTEADLAELETGLAEIPDYATAMVHYNTVEEGALPAGITKSTQSVVFEAANTLRQYFYLADGADWTAYTITVDDEEVDAIYDEESNRLYVEVPDIASVDLGQAHVFTITDGTTTFTRTASALSYAYSRIMKSSNPAMVNLAKVLYLYNLAAKEYFGRGA